MSNILEPEYSEAIFYTEKGISIITLVLSVYILYILFRFQKYNTFNNVIKIQLTFTCIIHMIPYLFGPQDSKQEKYDDQIATSCKVQTLLLAISMFNTIHFPMILTLITYISLKHPDTINKKEKCLKWTLSIISWFLALFGGFFVFFFCVKGAGEDLVCWLIKDIGIIALCIQTFVYLMIMIIFLYKIKIKIISLLKNEEIEGNTEGEYLKIFRKFFFSTMLTLCSLIFEVVTSFVSESLKDRKIAYFILLFLSCLIDILLYPSVLLIFCFTKIPIKDILPCIKSRNSNNRDNTIINLIESS